MLWGGWQAIEAMESAESAVSLAAAIARAAEWECLEAKVAEATSKLADMQVPVTRGRAGDRVASAAACVCRVEGAAVLRSWRVCRPRLGRRHRAPRGPGRPPSATRPRRRSVPAAPPGAPPCTSR